MQDREDRETLSSILWATLYAPYKNKSLTLKPKQIYDDSTNCDNAVYFNKL